MEALILGIPGNVVNEMNLMLSDLAELAIKVARIGNSNAITDGASSAAIARAALTSAGHNVLLNSTLERQKGKNMRNNPKVNVLVIDPNNVSRFLEVRGEVVEITQKGAIDHANKQTRVYSGDEKQLFYGDIYPEDTKDKETRVVFKILPTKVNVNAIFG